MLADSKQKATGKDGKYIKNTWILDNSSNRGDQLEDLQSKSSVNNEHQEKPKKKIKNSERFKVDITPDHSKPFETPIENLSHRRRTESKDQTKEVRLDFEKDFGNEDGEYENPNIVKNNFIVQNLARKTKKNPKERSSYKDQLVTLHKNPEAADNFISRESLKVEDMNSSEIYSKLYEEEPSKNLF